MKLELVGRIDLILYWIQNTTHILSTFVLLHHLFVYLILKTVQGLELTEAVEIVKTEIVDQFNLCEWRRFL